MCWYRCSPVPSSSLTEAKVALGHGKKWWCFVQNMRLLKQVFQTRDGSYQTRKNCLSFMGNTLHWVYDISGPGYTDTFSNRIRFSFRYDFKSIHFGLRIQTLAFSWSFSSFPCQQKVKPQRYRCVFKWKRIRVTGASVFKKFQDVAFPLTLTVINFIQLCESTNPVAAVWKPQITANIHAMMQALEKNDSFIHRHWC